MTTKTKTFDCVEMKHKGAEQILRQIRGMSREQELAFWNEGTRLLQQRQQQLRLQRGNTSEE